MVECAILEMLGSISVCHQKDDNSSNGGMSLVLLYHFSLMISFID